jgi:hypothetical protein
MVLRSPAVHFRLPNQDAERSLRTDHTRTACDIARDCLAVATAFDSFESKEHGGAVDHVDSVPKIQARNPRQ